MRSRVKRFIAALVTATLVWQSGPSVLRAETPFEPQVTLAVSELIVRFKDGTVGAMNAHSVGAKRVAGSSGVELLKLRDGSEAARALSALRQIPNVAYAEPNYQFKTQAAAPNDPRFAEQWGLTMSRAPEAWERALTALSGADAAPVTVAVVDTGVASAHSDLAGRVLPGRNLITGAVDPTDTTDDSTVGHGTRVAGIIAAATGNGTGIAGIGGTFPVSILPVKVLDATGTGTLFDIAQGIRWAADHGARVINLSLGAHLPDYPKTLAEAVQYAQSKGALVIAASGNLGAHSLEGFYPASLPGVISVGAVSKERSYAFFSNRPATMLAPGIDVLSTVPGGGYELSTGTSFAAPHVAGAAALLWAVAPGKHADEIGFLLGRTADTYTIKNCPTNCATVNPDAALQYLGYGWQPNHALKFVEPLNYRAFGQVKVAVSATNLAKVARVEFSVIGPPTWQNYETFATFTEPEAGGYYTATWDTTAVPDGWWGIAAISYDQNNAVLAWNEHWVAVSNEMERGVLLEVKKPGGNPAPRAQVLLTREGTPVWNGQTDLNGRVVLPGILADGQLFEVLVRGTSPSFLYRRSITGPGHVVLDGSDVTRVDLSGRTVGGAPLSNALIMAHPLSVAGDQVAAFTSAPLATLDSGGDTQLYISPGQYRLRLVSAAAAYYLTREVEVTSGAAQTVSFTPSAADVATVRLAPDSSFHRMALLLRDPNFRDYDGFDGVDPFTPITVSPGRYEAWISLTHRDPDLRDGYGNGLDWLLDLRPAPLDLVAGEERLLSVGLPLTGTAARLPGEEGPAYQNRWIRVAAKLHDAKGHEAMSVAKRSYLLGSAGVSQTGALTAVRGQISDSGEGGSFTAYDAGSSQFAPPTLDGRTVVLPKLWFYNSEGSLAHSTEAYGGYVGYSGSWQIPGTQPVGTYTAVTYLEGGPFGEAVKSGPLAFEVQAAPTGATPADATLAVKVLGPDGKPLKSASVFLLEAVGNRYLPGPQSYTDTYGYTYFWEHQYNPTKSYMVTLKGPGTEPVVLFRSVAQGATEIIIDLSTETLHRVEVKARDQSGANLGATMAVYGYDPAGTPVSGHQFHDYWETKPAVVQVPSGQYSFTAAGGSYRLIAPRVLLPESLPQDGILWLDGAETATVSMQKGGTWAGPVQLDGILLQHEALPVRNFAAFNPDNPPLQYTPGAYRSLVKLKENDWNYDYATWAYWLEQNWTLQPGAAETWTFTDALLPAVALDQAEYVPGGTLQSTHTITDGAGNRLFAVHADPKWYASLPPHDQNKAVPTLTIYDPMGAKVASVTDPGGGESGGTFDGAAVTLPADATGGLFTAALSLNTGVGYQGKQTFSVLAAPAAPVLDDPGATSATTVTVSGAAARGATVTVRYESGAAAAADTEPVAVDEHGRFSVDIPLAEAGTYTLTATAAYKGLTGPSSAAVSLLVDRTPPGAPVNLVGLAADDSHVLLTWEASPDSDVTAYRVSRGGAEIATVPVDGGLRFVDSGLTADTLYTYTVHALDRAGNLSETAPSTEVRTLLTPDTEPPTAPTGLAAAAQPDGSIRLTWTAATDNVLVNQYRIYRAPEGGESALTATVSGSETAYTDAGLVPGTYTYTVAAVDVAGLESQHSVPATADATALGDIERFYYTVTRNRGGLALSGGNLGLVLQGPAGLEASAAVTYRTWFGEGGVKLTEPAQAQTTVSLTEDPATPGTYRGSFPLEEGIASVTGITGSVGAAGGTPITAEAQGLPLHVSGSLSVMVAVPSNVSMAGSALEVWSLSKLSAARTAVSAAGAYPLAGLAPAEDFTIRLLAADGRVLLEASGVPVAAGLTGSITMEPALPATFQVQLVDEEGNPIEGIPVTLTNGQTNSFIWRGETAGTGFALPVRGKVSGDTIRVSADLPLPYVRVQPAVFTLAPGDNQQRITVSRMPGGAVTGRATRPDGLSLGNVRVTAVQELDGRNLSLTSTTAADGSYQIPLLAGPARLYVGSPDWRYYFPGDHQTVSVEHGQTVTQDLAMLLRGTGVITARIFVKRVGDADFSEVLLDETGSNYRFSFVKRSGYSDYSNYPIQIGAHSGEQVEVCANGAYHNLPMGCATVTLDEELRATAQIYLEERGARVHFRPVDAGTGTQLQSWLAEAFLLGQNGERVRTGRVLRDGQGGYVRLDSAGEYRLELRGWVNKQLRTAAVNFEAAAGDLINLGDVLLSPPGSFGGKEGNGLSSTSGRTPPGSLVTLRATYKHTGDTAAEGAVLLLSAPEGSALVPESVTAQNGAAGTLVNGVYELPLGTLQPGDSGVVRYQVRLNPDLEDSSLAATAAIRYNLNGATAEEILGAALIRMSLVSLDAPSHVNKPETTLTGRAPGGWTVRVYSDTVLLGETQASAAGYWKLPVSLAGMGAPRWHRLYAMATMGERVAQSASALVLYSEEQVRLMEVAIEAAGQRITFDPANGIGRFPLIMRPGWDVIFQLEFSDPDAVTDVKVHIGGAGGGTVDAVRQLSGLYQASIIPGELVDDIYVTYNVLPLSWAETPRLTVEQMKASLPVELQEAEVAPAPGEPVEVDGVTTYPSVTVTLPGQSDSPITMNVTVESLASFTPSQKDLDSVAKGNAPIYDVQIVEQGDGSLLISGVMANEQLQAAGMMTAQAGSFSRVAAHVGFEALDKGMLFSDIVSAGTGYSDNYIRVLSMLERIETSYCADGVKATYMQRAIDLGIENKNIIASKMLLTVVSVALAPTGVGWFAVTAFSAFTVFSVDYTWAENMKKLEDDWAAEDCNQSGGGSGGGERAGKVAKPAWIFDPSGYVYEGVPDNRIPGVTATALYRDPDTGTWIQWGAEWYGQVNPQITNEEGRYGWDVPAGWWKVSYVKEGYVPTESWEMEVPPPRTEVNVGMVSLAAPAVQTVTAVHEAGGATYVDITFTKHMKAAAFTAGTVTLATIPTEGEPASVAGSLSLVDPATDQYDPNQTQLVRTVRFNPDTALTAGASYTVTVSQVVQSHASQLMAADHVQQVKVPAAAGDTAPVISGLTPAPGALVTEARPVIQATVTDDFGVAADGIRMTLDGAPVEATLSGTLVTYTPPTALAQGAHSVTLSVTDTARTPAEITWSFTVDAQAPVLTITANPTQFSGSGPIAVTVSSSEALEAAPVLVVSFGAEQQTLLLTSSGPQQWAGSFQAAGGTNYTLTATGTDLAGLTGTGIASVLYAVPSPPQQGPAPEPEPQPEPEPEPEPAPEPEPEPAPETPAVPREEPGEVTDTVSSQGLELPASGGAVKLMAPAGAFAPGTRVTMKPALQPQPAPLTGLRPVGAAVAITSERPPIQPVTVQFRFDPASLAGADHRKLGVYRQDEHNPDRWTYAGGVVDLTAGEVHVQLTGFSTYALLLYERSFPDLIGHWSRADVEVLASRHVVHGVDEFRFEPDRAITRAEFAKLLVSMLGSDPARRIQVTGPAAPSFADVPTSAWYYAYVETAARLGIVQGHGGRFRPGAPISRQEMAAMVIRAMGLESEAGFVSIVALKYTDGHEIADWANGYMVLATRMGLIGGVSATEIQPRSRATRAQASVVLLRAMDRMGLVTVR